MNARIIGIHNSIRNWIFTRIVFSDVVAELKIEMLYLE